MPTPTVTEPVKTDVLTPDMTEANDNPITSGGRAPGRRISASEINAAATKLQQENRIPPKPGDNVDEVQLQKWLDLLTPAMWDKLMIYINRLYPRINRKMGDPDAYKYIDVVTREAIETSGGTIRKHIVQNHGGGKYILYINDTSRTAQKQTVFEAFCTITFDEADPKLNLDEVELHNKENASYVAYLQNKGILDAQKRVIKQGSAAGNSGGNTSGGSNISELGNLFTQIATTMQKLNPQQKDDLAGKGMTEIFLERLKQEDPNKQFVGMAAMLAAMKDMFPKPDTSNSLSMKDVIQMMNENHTKQIEMFKMMLDSQQKNSGKDEDSDLDKLIKWKTALPELFGRRGGSGDEREKSTAEIVIDAVKEVGLPVLGIVSQMIQAKTGAVPIIPVTPGQAQAHMDNMQRQQTQHNPAAIAAAAPQPPDNVIPIQQAQPGEQEDKGLVLLQTYLLNFGNMIVNSLKNGQTGIDVGEYIKGLAPMLGEDVYEVIKAQGKDKLLLAMKSIPAFWQQTGELYGEKRMEQFVEEFMEFEEILQREEDEDESTGKGKKGE